MKKQLQGIALILLSILLMLGFGNAPLFDFSLRWSFVFAIVGIAALAVVRHAKNKVRAPHGAEDNYKNCRFAENEKFHIKIAP